MSFSWEGRTPPRPSGADRRDQVAADELASRAALLYRLGYSEDQATQRLIERCTWEHEDKRPAALTDQAIGKIVRDTFARKPG